MLPLVLACDADEASPARLVVGIADTVVLNHTREVQIPLRVLSAEGELLSDSAVRYQVIGGASLSVTPRGMVTCADSRDATLEARLGGLRNTFVVRCRPVTKLHIAGPVQFLFPDTAQDLHVLAEGVDGGDVTLLRGTSSILDSSIADIDGIRVIPKSPGSTIGTVQFGNQSASVGVHVYETATTLDGLARGKELIGIPLRMSAGETKSFRLAAGTWMVTMLPEADETTGLQLRFDGANCSELRLTRRRYGCLVRSEGRLTVSHPSTLSSAGELEGQLLVRVVNP